MLRDLEKPSELVEGSWQCVNRATPSCRGTQSSTVHRCVRQGLGCTFGKPDSEWTVVGHREKFAHKCSGIESSIFGNKVLPVPLIEQEGLGGLRQCSVLSQQTRGDPFLRNVSNDMASDGLLQPQTIFSKGSSHTGLSETEWSLHPKIFLMICQIWHRPMVDMFATKMNNKLPLYVSPVPDPNAMAADALNISWEALDGYAYCPIALIPKMLMLAE